MDPRALSQDLHVTQSSWNEIMVRVIRIFGRNRFPQVSIIFPCTVPLVDCRDLQLGSLEANRFFQEGQVACLLCIFSLERAERVIFHVQFGTLVSSSELREVLKICASI